MAEQYIYCPKCNSKIPLSKVITSQIEKDIKSELDKKYQKQLKDTEKEYEAQITELTDEIKKKAYDEIDLEISDLKNQLEEKTEKLKKSQQYELELRKKERELEEKKDGFELEFLKKIQEEKLSLEKEIQQKFDEEYRLKEAEKEKQITDMRKQIDDLKRKAEQGSQQSQGEVLELELENILRNSFPFDIIEPVPTGITGADVIHKVYSNYGIYCGSIVWESKRTKNWNKNWIDKLKDDIIKVKGDIGVIYTTILPQDINSFGYSDGIWITDYPSLIGLTLALRIQLISIANERAIQSGKEEKKEILYNYLSSPEFRQKIEAVVNAFVTMKTDLESEKRVMKRHWAKREKQLERIVENTARIYGELEGIIGQEFKPIDSLELEMLPEGEK